MKGLGHLLRMTLAAIAATAAVGAHATTIDGVASAASPARAILPSAGGQGYAVVAGDGSVATFGDAVDAGQVTGALNRPIVGAAQAGGTGYWMVASDGGVFPFGSAIGYGSTGGIRLNQPIVGMAASPTGHGYWLVASDGGIFPFGDAAGYGSTGSVKLNQPIVGMTATASGRGYWLVARDGGIFPFGDAAGYGSTGSVKLNQPIVGMAATASGHGYWLVAADGGMFPFGDAGGYGSTGSTRLAAPIAAMASTDSGRGYWLLAGDGSIFAFGDARNFGSSAPANSSANTVQSWQGNSLHSADGGLNVNVGVYSDCTGRTTLTASEAALDVCVASVRWYFVGHHPGPFSPMMNEGVGSVITFVDSSGVQHALRVVATRDVTWYPGVGPQAPVSADVVAQFQTCLNPQGTLDRIFDAVPA